ncbi:hypothetical protein GPECTOR_39g406 [Gonium pectorale]|uniref:Uncharacterized protein n=1 Tax=Gonium pectorale TaxID=33097 RepID=A0A150GAP1_GONPE|nr:hypothetical protein GPECTOR_39g406 [Gonium pectorale]|eukprot:KXZ46912.1 hypothetical protein GPECTOR_39g406 [Gonium pectorale]
MIHTAAMFDTRERRREGRYLTDAEMGQMYDKFVGPDSLNNAALRHEHYERSVAMNSGYDPGDFTTGTAAAVAARSRAGSVAASSPRGSSRAGGDKPSDADVDAAAADGIRPPRPPSAAFRAVPRDRAMCQGTKFLYGGPSHVPGPAKYSPRYSVVEKDTHVRDWSRTVGAPAPGEGRFGAARPGSAPATGRPGSAPSPSRRGGGAAAASTAGPGGVGSGEPAAAAAGGPGGGGGRSMSRSRSMGAAAMRHADLFAGAHPVHPRKPPKPPGTQPFKATGRKTPDASTPGSHLFGAYYNDQYDRYTRPSSRPSSAFGLQASRPPMLPGSLPAQCVAHGETSPALGPGAYSLAGALPGTHTGRHVTAGHSPLSHTRDWSRGTERPCSAPPVRPPAPPAPPATALQQGYWGPDGPTSSFFPDEPQYAELVALQVVQEKTRQRELAQAHRAPSPSRPGSALPGGGYGSDAGGGGGGGGEARPLVYVGPERHSELTSAGLARKVYGGAFGKASREEAAHALRAMSDNKVTPPAAVAVKAVQDLSYTYDISVEGHRGRPPAWGLPPNRAALSAKWVGAAASALLEGMS